jgi:hypothetical protein
VSHHPPTSAYYARGQGFEAWGAITPKNKFWGKQIEFLPEGPLHVILTGKNDEGEFFFF